MSDLLPSPRFARRVASRNARLFAKNVTGTLLPQFLDPLFYLFALGFGLGTYIAQINGVPYKEFIAPGLVASSAMWAASFECTYNVYIRMNEMRLYDAVLSTPVEVQDVVAGDLAWGAIRATIYSSVFLAVVAAFGLIGSWWALAIPPLMLIGGLCFAAVAYTYTALIPRIDLYNYFFTLIVTPMFLFSGIFFPFNRLPAFAEVIAWFTPLYHVVEITRGLSTSPSLALLGDVLWLAVVSAVLFVVPVRALRRRLVA
ncbi:MAG: ABC transporter permease [Solirubrobacterales bacterium]